MTGIPNSRRYIDNASDVDVAVEYLRDSRKYESLPKQKDNRINITINERSTTARLR